MTEKKSEYLPNRKFAKEDRLFRTACGIADVSPTKRQASKFRLKRGRAYQAYQQHLDKSSK